MAPSTFVRTSAVLLAACLSAAAQNRQVELEWLRNAGAVFTGSEASDKFGHSVSAAGDVNGDGSGDFLVGAHQNAGDFLNDPPGRVYLFYGAPGVTAGGAGEAVADAIFVGEDNAWETGFSVAAAGDVDGDGYDDILIGANRAETNNHTGSGRVYLIWGDPALGGTVNLAALSASQGVVINGADTSDLLGSSLDGVGDVDGDGAPDILIGAHGEGLTEGQNARGSAYVLYGDAALPALIEIEAPVGATVLKLTGAATSDDTGEAVAGAGDVDADGFADLLIGAERAPSGAATNGAAYIVYGGAALPGAISLSSLGALGTVVNGQFTGDVLSNDLDGGGDLDDDGFADVVIGALTSDVVAAQDQGRAYVLFGGPALAASINASTIGASTPGLVLNGIDPFDAAGSGVACGGDFNGDGVSDLLVASSAADPNGDSGAGEVAVLLGRSTLASGTLSLSALDEDGLLLAGVLPGDAVGSNLGHCLGFAGDVDGDGFSELLLGAENSDPAGSQSGSAWLVKGACHMLQAAGPVADGGVLNLRAHGAPSVANVTFASVAALPTPLATKFGPWWLIAQFTLFGAAFGANGELNLPLPLPPAGSVPGLVGLTVHMQVMGQPQGEKCDLTYLLSFTIE
jgi:hypothetical protein